MEELWKRKFRIKNKRNWSVIENKNKFVNEDENTAAYKWKKLHYCWNKITNESCLYK